MNKVTAVDRMLLPVFIISSLHLAAADGFLDSCSVDRWYPIGNTLVVDVLEVFNKDLKFVQASVESQQQRDYMSLVEEMRNMSSKLEKPASVKATYQFFLSVLVLLLEGRFNEAASQLDPMRFDEVFVRGWMKSYFDYLQAETHRLLGHTNEALDSLLSSFGERRNSVGVSLNILERLDAIIVLQRVAQFNQDVDRLYGLKDGLDSQLLSLVHFMIKDDLRPLNDLKSHVSGRLFKTHPSINTSDAAANAFGIATPGMQRAYSSSNELTGRNVARTKVESILCEFAQKLSILGVSSSDDTPTDYSVVINQLRRLDPDFAEILNSKLVKNIGNGVEHVLEEAQQMMWSDIWVTAPPTNEVQVIFAFYFCIETTLRSKDSCDKWTMSELQQDLDSIKFKRRLNEGVSLDKIVELEARVVLLWIECFHKRLTKAYKLNGGEDEQQKEAKRALYGSCDRIQPDSERQ